MSDAIKAIRATVYDVDEGDNLLREAVRVMEFECRRHGRKLIGSVRSVGAGDPAGAGIIGYTYESDTVPAAVTSWPEGPVRG